MKILICAMRHWTAGRRFRSVLLNAPKLGHEVFGLAANWYGDQALAITAFNELGVQAFPKEGWQNTLERLNPDVVFGDHILPTEVEQKAQDWVNSHNKIGLLIGHHAYSTIIMPAYYTPRVEWPHTYGLIASQQTGLRNLPKERVFVLGISDLDFVAESVDTAEVRDRLGLAPNQPLIGLFPTLAMECDHGELTTLVDKCQEAGWQVVIHVHPNERHLQNSEPPNGFWIHDREFVAAHFWPKMEAMGARFIADYAPGRTCGVQFHRCQSFELIQAADCLIGDPDPFFEAYALRKGYTLLASQAPHLLRMPGQKRVLDPEFELQDNFTKVSKVLERGNDIEQDPAFVETWFYKLDGLWWKRALELAEQLTRDNLWSDQR